MELNRLLEFVVIFSLSISVLLVCHKVKIPMIVGFLLTGVLGGPYAFGLVSSAERVAPLADLGIILLLFSIGMEFSIKNLMLYKRFFFLGGMLQVALTSLALLLVLYLFGIPSKEAIFIGWLIALSSTAIVLKVLEQMKMSDTPQGKMVLGVLIFQDLIAVPMMLLTPLLSDSSSHLDLSFFTTIGKGLVLLFIVFICAERIIPWLFFQITKTGSRELFLLAVLCICFFVAWLAASVGLSLSLGAFLAGLILSESDYKNNALGDVLPFEEVFTSFFFISIGMLLDVPLFFSNLHWIIPLTIGIILLKSLFGSIAALLVGLPLRSAVVAGIAVSQIGEFSFVLAKTGFSEGVIHQDHYQLFLSLALSSMAVAPSLILFSPRLAELAEQFLPLPDKIKSGLFKTPHAEENVLEDHVIIIGFGICGRKLAQACQAAEVPFAIIEMNPQTVLNEKRNGLPISFGDGTHPAVLSHVNIQSAKSIAVLINEAQGCQRIVSQARQLNPKIYIISRVKYFAEMQAILSSGADDVIVDEIGASFEIFSKMMGNLNLPLYQIQKIISDLQFEIYDASRISTASFLLEQGLKIENFTIPEHHPLVGKKLAESNLKDIYGFSVLMIKRDHEVLLKLSGETVLQVNDFLVLIGSKSTQLENLTSYIDDERHLAHNFAQ